MSFDAFALTPKEQKGVKVLTSSHISYESPTRFQPIGLTGVSEDIAYRTSLLPFSGAQDYPLYVVIPTLGLIAPIVEIPPWTKDHMQMIDGKSININTYLSSWVLHYPGTALPGQIWNIVIFWHSNFLRQGVGDYKTIFADLMNLDVWPYDEIRIYQKGENDFFNLFKYTIEQSYETNPQDVEILLPIEGEELTVFACTNGIEWRWIIKARRVSADEFFVPYALKFRLYEALQKLAHKDADRQMSIRNEVLIALERKRIHTGLQVPSAYIGQRWYLFSYLEKQLTKQ